MGEAEDDPQEGKGQKDVNGVKNERKENEKKEKGDEEETKTGIGE